MKKPVAKKTARKVEAVEPAAPVRMGRPPLEGNRKPMTIRLPVEVMEFFQAHAEVERNWQRDMEEVLLSYIAEVKAAEARKRARARKVAA